MATAAFVLAVAAIPMQDKLKKAANNASGRMQEFLNLDVYE
jgi:hypothetical protein